MREITQEIAVRFIEKMQGFYGKRFSDLWTGVSTEIIVNGLLDCLSGLDQQDLVRGYKRMIDECEWPPTWPELRKLCKSQVDAWIDAHEAWAIAKSSVDYHTGRELTVVWTEPMAKAFARCQDLVMTGDKYQLAEAKKIFVAVYERLVVEAKERNEQPFYKVSLGVDPDQRIEAIKQAEIEGYLTASEAALQLEHKQTKMEQLDDVVKFKTTAQKAIAELREKLKIKADEKAQKPEAKPEPTLDHLPPDSAIWPDPFDNRHAYIDMLKADGKPVPRIVA